MSEERAPEPQSNQMLRSYSAVSGCFDELEEAPGVPRMHWQPFLTSLERLGRQGLVSRSENGRRLIREHGVTYKAYGDPEGMTRPWGLDIVPLLITAEEWARLEIGLIQRSRLFNLILADIYAGRQRLLREGFVPPELIYGNPGFLRPCRGIQVPKQVYLHLHACELGRSPDGQWWVLSDSTQAPSGIGYAWENRAVVSRILPESIRECNVQALGGFFRQEREMLLGLAPPGHAQPTAVLLTSGPHNEAYFEHAFLARHLGIPLVEGADLTIRDRRVYLKTIEGLERVDVIVRRVDDTFCDPLELRGDSFLGVSGLVEASRAGNVTLANALGSGLLESPAFLAFLPNLCRHLLSEELLLPSVATWWCGQPQELRYVTDHLGTLTFKPAFGPHGPQPPAAGDARKSRRKAAADRNRLLEKLRDAPNQFVAQEQIPLSRAPSWVDSGLSARAVVLRAFVANGGDSMAVLPGGLTRVSRTPEGLLPTMQSGRGSSKDTWILSNTGLPRPEPPQVTIESKLGEHLAGGVPSRAADHLYWLGRYTERLEQLLRVLRCILSRISGEPNQEHLAEVQALTELALNLGVFADEQVEPVNGQRLGERVLRILGEPEFPDGARGLVKQIRAAASAVRDRFSGDTWRILGRLDADSRLRSSRLPIAGATALIHRLVVDLAAFSGVEMENMTRGLAWRFLDLGRRLERAQSIVRLLHAAVGVETEPALVLEPVLEIADSVMTYRRLFFDRPRAPGVLALLIRDESNPRSLTFQLRVLREHTEALKVSSRNAVASDSLQIRSISDAIESVDFTGLAAQHAAGAAKPLLDLLNAWMEELAKFSDQVTSRYFSHSVPRMS